MRGSIEGPLWLRVGLCFIGLLFVVLALQSASVASPEPVDISWNNYYGDRGEERWFYPGPGYGEIHSRYWCLSEAATVDITVTDSQGQVVRTLASGVSEDGRPFSNSSCGYWLSAYKYLQWDGLTDAGDPAPAGSYHVNIKATDPDSNTDEITAPVQLQRPGPAGSFTQPSPGDTISGMASFRLVPAEGFDVYAVYMDCLGWTETPEADGTFASSADTRNCADGPTDLRSWIYFLDPAGAAHTYAPAPIPVTINNPVDISWNSYNGDTGQERWFYPGPGYGEIHYRYWCLSEAATVDITVTDAQGQVVRTLASGVSEDGRPFSNSSCGYWLSAYKYLQWDGLTDAGDPAPAGSYHVNIKATDSDSNTDEITAPVQLQRPGPAGNTSKPAEGDTLAGWSELVFSPSANLDTSEVHFYFSRGPSQFVYAPSPDGKWRTHAKMGDYPNGAATVSPYVYFNDPAGIQHAWVDVIRNVAIDNTSIPLHVSVDPQSGYAPLGVTFTVEASEPKSRPLSYTVDFGDGSTVTGTIEAPYDPVTLTKTYEAVGAYQAQVIVSNGVGSSTQQLVAINVEDAPNIPPVADLTISPATGVVPLNVIATIEGNDEDGDDLTFELDWGDGSPRVTGALPTDPIGHTYERRGNFSARLAVSDGRQTDIDTASVIVSLAEPLSANAGDDLVAFVGDPVRLDGSASRPEFGIEQYRWTFGDGETAEGTTVTHIYDEVGVYTARLRVQSGGESSIDEIQVDVRPVPRVPGLSVTVKSQAGEALRRATVVVNDSDGDRYEAETDTSGRAVLQGLPDGEHTIYVWKSGYRPKAAQATVNDGDGSVDVVLQPGEAATASVSSREMTQEEIEEAGIDPNDPDNQHVYEFEIHLAFEPEGRSGYVGGGGGGGGFGGGWIRFVGGEGGTCNETTCYWTTADRTYTVVVRGFWVDDKPSLLWLIIPGEARVLKQFFDVSMMVTNLADPEFVLAKGSASLPLPAGLSLAPTAAPQNSVIAVEDIPGGQSRSATWIVRGDVEGAYTLTADYSGSLEPIGIPLSLSASTVKPLQVWGSSALKMIVEAESQVWDIYPYRVRIGLQNQVDVPIYNPAVELKTDGKLNYVYQPRERLEQRSAVIPVGGTFWTDDYVLVPEISGILSLEHSYVKKVGGDVDYEDEIRSRAPLYTPETSPAIGAVELGGDTMGLLWVPIPGATEYQIFSVDDRGIDFGNEPLAVVEGDRDRVLLSVDTNETDWFAVSAVVAGKNWMFHRLISSDSAQGFPMPWSTIQTSAMPSCGADIQVTLTFEDLFSPPTEYEYILGSDTHTGELDAVWSSSAGEVDGHAFGAWVDNISFTVEATSVDRAAGLELRAKSWSQDGREGHVARKTLKVTCHVIGLGDSYSSGEGALAYEEGTNKHEEPKNLCHRAQGTAWAQLLNKEFFASSDYFEFDFKACSGALISHVNQEAQYPPTQAEQVTYVQSGTRLITLSISGNDAGFRSIIEACLAGDCSAEIPGRISGIQTALQDLEALWDDLHQAAPQAQILVVGYPRLFPEIPYWNECYLGWTTVAIPNPISVGKFDIAEQIAINEFADALNAAVEESTQSRSWVHFANIRESLSGFELCSVGNQITPHIWGTAPGNDIGLDPYCCIGNESFHPTPIGHWKMYQNVRAKYLEIQGLVGPTDDQTAPEAGAQDFRIPIYNNEGKLIDEWLVKSDPRGGVVRSFDPTHEMS